MSLFSLVATSSREHCGCGGCGCGDVGSLGSATVGSACSYQCKGQCFREPSLSNAIPQLVRQLVNWELMKRVGDESAKVSMLGVHI